MRNWFFFTALLLAHPTWGQDVSPLCGEVRPSTLQKIQAVWDPLPGRKQICGLKSNGNRAVVIYLSKDLDPLKPILFQIYFHGKGGNADRHLRRLKLFPKLMDVEKTRPQTVFVFPTFNKYPFDDWMNGNDSSYRNLVEEVQTIASQMAGQPLKTEKIIVNAHSAGGEPVRNAIVADEFSADKINDLDAAYGDWGKVLAKWAAKQAPHVKVETWYTAHQAQRHREMATLAPQHVEIHETKGLRHNEIPSHFFGKE